MSSLSTQMMNGQRRSVASPSLLLTIELPALDARTNLSFAVKPGRQHHVLDTVEDFVQGLLADTEDDVDVDKDCTEMKLERLRKHAASASEDWQAKLRSAEEWERKVTSAGEKMNQMRNAYWKELLHWKEQVYRQKEADQKGDSSWQPTYAVHFDPSEYHMDDEVAQLVHDKVQLVEQTWEAKMKELEVGLRARITSLNESLIVTKMKLYRKDKMLQVLIDRHGYKEERDLNALPCGIDESRVQQISDSIERKAQRAETKAQKDFAKKKTQDLIDVGTEPVPNLKTCFHAFLVRKFGSLKEAQIQVALTQDLHDKIGRSEFEVLANSLGFASDLKETFIELSHGAPLIVLQSIFDDNKPGAHRARRHSTCALSTSARDLLCDGFDATVKEALEVRRNSLGNAAFRDFQELQVGVQQDEYRDTDSDSYSSSESSLGSSHSTRFSRPGSKESSNVQGEKKLHATACQSSIKTKSNPPKTVTHVSIKRDSKAAFAPGSGVQRGTVDASTDPMPFGEAFRKIEFSSQGCQCDIDAQVLDKAMESLKSAAKDDWKALAFMPDDFFEIEAPKGSDASERQRAATLASPMRSKKIFKKAKSFASTSAFASSCCSNLPLARGYTADTLDVQSPGYLPPCTSDKDERQSGQAVQSPGDLLSPCNLDIEHKQCGQASSLVALVSPRFVETRSATAALQSSPEQGLERDKEAQCKAVQCDLLVSPSSSLEQRLPRESDPLEAQIQQLEQLTGDVEKSLPITMARVEKLCSESGCEAAQSLQTKLVESMSAVADLPASKALSTTREEDRQTDDGRISSILLRHASVQDVLQRHGIPVEASACCSGPLEEGRSTSAGDGHSCMRGLVGEASRMSFGSNPSPRLSFTGVKHQKQRRLPATARLDEINKTGGSFSSMSKESGSPSPSPKAGVEKLTFFSPVSDADTPSTSASPCSDVPLSDVFNMGRRIRIAPRQPVLADASLAIANKLRKRQLLGDRADDGGELQCDTSDAEMVQSSQSECSPHGTFLTTTSLGHTAEDSASGLDRRSQMSSERARETCNSEAGIRNSKLGARDFFSDCDSVADHLDDVMLAEFKSDKPCPTQLAKLDFLGNAGYAMQLHTNDLDMPAASCSLHCEEVQMPDELAKLPNIRSPKAASSKEASPRSCQTLLLAEDAGTALRLSERANTSQPPKRRTSLHGVVTSLIQKQRSAKNSLERRPSHAYQRRNSATCEMASSSSSATGPPDAPPIAIFGQGQGQWQHGAPMSPQQPADHSPTVGSPGTSNSKNPRHEMLRRRYSTN